MLSLRQRRGLFAFVVVSAAISTAALALEPSGSAVRVTRITDADGPGGARPLVTEGPVYMGDTITTNPNGLAQIRFADDTRIVVGPNSHLVIDSFVFNPDNTAREVTVNAAQGFFRFISGNSPSEAYTIRTPTMTIGLRGTAGDFHTKQQPPETRVVVLDGIFDGCALGGGECEELIPSCRLYYAASDGAVDTPQGLDGRLQLSAYFLWLDASGQNELEAPFRLDVSSCFLADNRLLERTPEPQDTIPTERPRDDDEGDPDDEEEEEDNGGCGEGQDCDYDYL